LLSFGENEEKKKIKKEGETLGICPQGMLCFSQTPAIAAETGIASSIRLERQ